jgi:hypothetical protein
MTQEVETVVTTEAPQQAPSMFASAMAERGLTSFAATQAAKTDAPSETPPAVETTEETPEAVETTTTETTAAAEAPKVDDEPVFKASFLREKFGTDNLDEIHEKVSKLSAVEQRALELEQERTNLAAFRDYVQNPFADSRFKEADIFARKTGIGDPEVAMKFSGKTAEDIATRPLDALALREMIANPQVKMTFSEIREAVGERLGLDADISYQDLTASQKYELQRAVSEITSSLSKEVEGVNQYDKFVNERQQTTAQRKAVLDTWNGKTAVNIKSVQQDIEVEDGKATKIDIPVSDATRKQIEQEIVQYVNNLANPAPYTEAVAKEIEEFARVRALQLESANALKIVARQAYSIASGAAKEQAVKEFHNPAPVVRQEKPEAPKTVTDADQVGSVLRQSLEKLGRR